MKFSNRKTLSFFLLLTIYLIPILGLIDFLISVGILDGVSERSRSSNPYPYIIVIKEILALLIFLYLALIAIKEGKISKISYILIIFISFLTVNASSIESVVAGVRESVGLVYISLGVYVIRAMYAFQEDKVFLLKFIRAIKIIFLIEFIMTLVQIKYMPGYEGLTMLGSRVIGSFTNPNTVGVF